MGGGAIGVAGDFDWVCGWGIDTGRSVCQYANRGRISPCRSRDIVVGGVFDGVVYLCGGAVADGGGFVGTAICVGAVVFVDIVATVGRWDSVVLVSQGVDNSVNSSIGEDVKMCFQKSISIVFIVGGLLSLTCLIATAQTADHKYHKEVFLRMPVWGVNEDNGIPQGPVGIGIDNNDNFCIYGVGLSIYNSEGKKIHEYIYKDEGGRHLAVMDFCFDNEGSIYLLHNSSGEGGIYKSDSEGRIVGVMGKGPRSDEWQWRLPFLRSQIACLSGQDLFLFEGWQFFPFKFVDGTTPYWTTIKEGLPFPNGTRVSGIYVNDDSLGLNIYNKGESKSALYLAAKDNKRYCYIYSIDPEYEYYYTYWFDPVTDKFSDEICKYKGLEFLFSTGELPPPATEGGAKRAMVDRKGTIYYYGATSEEILILRWVLE